MLLREYSDCYDLAYEYGLQIVKGSYSANLCVMAGDLDQAALASDPRVIALQPNAQTILSEPVDLTMGFNQGDWDDGSVERQDALAPLSLPILHRTVQGRGVRVAVLDTGVDPTHPHLAGHVELPSAYGLPAIETANGIDDDGDGRVDEAYGHGTHVAGIILTVAPQVTILPMRVLNDDGVGDVYELALGLHQALMRHADIVNLSLVLSGQAEVIDNELEQLQAAGIVVVAAAGNTPGEVRYPASASGVLSVAATAAGDVLASFSASRDVRLAAPGVDVQSSFPGNRSAYASGTSMACAVVSGCVALLAEHVSVGGVPHFEKAVQLLSDTAVTVVPEGSIYDGRVAPGRAILANAAAGPSVAVAVPEGPGETLAGGARR